MSLFITKKVTVIYRLSKPFFFISLVFTTASLFAQSDLHTFCFDKSVRLKAVEQSISFLLLPKDTLNLREQDYCIDIVASVDRGKLFEKFLSQRYNLVRSRESNAGELEHCTLTLKTTVNSMSDTRSVKLGEKNSLNKAEQTSTSISTMELVFGQGLSGELEAGHEKLKVLCQLIGIDKANLKFQFSEKGKGAIVAEYLLKRGDWFNLGSVLNDLKEKNKMLGIPQTEMTSTIEKSETQYNLKIK